MRNGFYFTVDAFFSVLLTFVVISIIASINFSAYPHSINTLDSVTHDYLVLKYQKGLIAPEVTVYDFGNIRVQESRPNYPLVAHSVYYSSPVICNGNTQLQQGMTCLNSYDLPSQNVKKEAWGYYK